MKYAIGIYAGLFISSYTTFGQECSTINNGKVNIQLAAKVEKREAASSEYRILTFPQGAYGKITLFINEEQSELILDDPYMFSDYVIKLDKNASDNKVKIKIEGPLGCMMADLLTEYKNIEFTKQDSWLITYSDK